MRSYRDTKIYFLGDLYSPRVLLRFARDHKSREYARARVRPDFAIRIRNWATQLSQHFGFARWSGRLPSQHTMSKVHMLMIPMHTADDSYFTILSASV